MLMLSCFLILKLHKYHEVHMAEVCNGKQEDALAACNHNLIQSCIAEDNLQRYSETISRNNLSKNCNNVRILAENTEESIYKSILNTVEAYEDIFELDKVVILLKNKLDEFFESDEATSSDDDSSIESNNSRNESIAMDNNTLFEDLDAFVFSKKNDCLYKEIDETLKISINDIQNMKKKLYANIDFLDENTTIENLKLKLVQKFNCARKLDESREELCIKKLALQETLSLKDKIEKVEIDINSKEKAVYIDYYFSSNFYVMKMLSHELVVFFKEKLVKLIENLNARADIHKAEIAEEMKSQHFKTHECKEECNLKCKEECLASLAHKIAEASNKLKASKKQLSLISTYVCGENPSQILTEFKKRKYAVKEEKRNMENITGEIISDHKNAIQKGEVPFYEFRIMIIFFLRSKEFQTICKEIKEMNTINERISKKIISNIRVALQKPFECFLKCDKIIEKMNESNNKNMSKILWSLLDEDEYNIKAKGKFINESVVLEQQEINFEDFMIQNMVEQLFLDNLKKIDDIYDLSKPETQYQKKSLEKLKECFKLKSPIYLSSVLFDNKEKISNFIHKTLFKFFFRKIRMPQKKTEAKEGERPSKRSKVEKTVNFIREDDLKYKDYVFLETYFENYKFKNIIKQNNENLNIYNAKLIRYWDIAYKKTIVSCYKTNKKINLTNCDGNAQNTSNSNAKLSKINLCQANATITFEDRINVVFMWYVFYMLNFTHYIVDTFFVLDEDISEEIFLERLLSYNSWSGFRKPLCNNKKDKSNSKIYTMESFQYFISKVIQKLIEDYNKDLKHILENLSAAKKIKLREGINF